MISTLVHVALVLSLAAGHFAAELQMTTPKLTQCGDVDLQWNGGTAPYQIFIVPTSDPCADSLVDIPEQTGTSYKWKVNLPENGVIDIYIEDSNEQEGWSGAIVIQNSTDSSCVDQEAAQALHVAPPKGSSVSSTVYTGYSLAPSAAAETPGVTVSPTVVPSKEAPANAEHGLPKTSGSISRIALPTNALYATAAFLLVVAQL